MKSLEELRKEKKETLELALAKYRCKVCRGPILGKMAILHDGYYHLECWGEKLEK